VGTLNVSFIRVCGTCVDFVAFALFQPDNGIDVRLRLTQQPTVAVRFNWHFPSQPLLIIPWDATLLQR
jgi:hypothetical protein